MGKDGMVVCEEDLEDVSIRTRCMRQIARGLALIWACWWFFFGLVSGAGKGFKGILANAPNALPGLVFLVSVAIAWHREAAGGIVPAGFR